MLPPMAASRPIVIAMVVLLLAAACGSSILTADERDWCRDNPDAVLDSFGTLFAGRAVVNDFADAYIAALGDDAPNLGDFLRNNYREEYEQSCQAAYAAR
jgi:hypothetical protein